MLGLLGILGLLALLTGLLGMHGLGPATAHPTPRAATHAAPAVHPAAAGPDQGDFAPDDSVCCSAHSSAASATEETPSAARLLVPAGPVPHAPGPMVHAGQLCLAVLAAGLFLLPLLLALARTRLPGPGPSARARGVAAGARRSLPGPSLAALSVLRI